MPPVECSSLGAQPRPQPSDLAQPPSCTTALLGHNCIFIVMSGRRLIKSATNTDADSVSLLRLRMAVFPLACAYAALLTSGVHQVHLLRAPPPRLVNSHIRQIKYTLPLSASLCRCLLANARPSFSAAFVGQAHAIGRPGPRPFCGNSHARQCTSSLFCPSEDSERLSAL